MGWGEMSSKFFMNFDDLSFTQPHSYHLHPKDFKSRLVRDIKKSFLVYEEAWGGGGGAEKNA